VIHDCSAPGDLDELRSMRFCRGSTSRSTKATSYAIPRNSRFAHGMAFIPWLWTRAKAALAKGRLRGGDMSACCIGLTTRTE
jgi:hypothetical protein